jgi:hypothetical protein
MFNLEELSIFRESLNVITIKGSEAKIISNLQIKVENHITKMKEGPSIPKQKEDKK